MDVSVTMIDSKPITFTKIRLAARRNVWLICIWIACSFIMGVVYLITSPDVYTASATVVLDPRRSTSFTGDTNSASAAPSLDAAQAESQIQVIKSERLLSYVFDNLELIKTRELNPVRAPTALKSLANIFSRHGGLDQGDEETSSAQLKAKSFQNFVNRVSARRVGQSYVIEVSYSSGNPGVARNLANSIVSAYLVQQISFKLASAQNGAEYLQSRITALANEVKLAKDGMLIGAAPSNLLPDADARVIGAALEPLARSAPKTGLVLAFSLSVGLLISGASLLVLCALDKKIRTIEELESLSDIPWIAEISPSRQLTKLFDRMFQQENVGKFEWTDLYGHSLIEIRNFLFSCFQASNICVGFVSFEELPNQSRIIALIGRCLASAGKPVRLVDASVKVNERNLSDILRAHHDDLRFPFSPQASDLEKVIMPLGGKLDLIPSKLFRNSSQNNYLVDFVTASETVSALKGSGHVVVELPAFGGRSNNSVTSTIVDGIILLVQLDKTEVSEIDLMLSNLRRRGSKILGVVTIRR
jgi:capsular polysaccharide biosynthesis protein